MSVLYAHCYSTCVGERVAFVIVKAAKVCLHLCIHLHHLKSFRCQGNLPHAFLLHWTQSVCALHHSFSPPYNLSQGAKGYEKAEDPIYALDHNLTIDYQHYLEHFLSQPLMRIFEPVMKDPKALLSGVWERVSATALCICACA